MDFVFKIGVLCVESVELCLSFFKEFDGYLLEKRIGKDVLVLNRPRLDRLAQLIKLRRKCVGGTFGHGLIVSDDLLPEFG